MAHFAELGLGNVVQRVIVVNNIELIDDNNEESEAKGVAFCQNLLGGRWVQTSYNATFRKNFAAKGFVYDASRDAFIPPKPYKSWVLDEQTCRWFAPIEMPEYNPETQLIHWDEESQQWVIEEQ